MQHYVPDSILQLLKLPWFNAIWGTIVGVLIVNKFLNDYLQINFLKKLLAKNHISSFQESRIKRKKLKFYAASSSNEFIQWQNDVLNKIYHEVSFTNLFGVDYPIVCIEGEGQIYYPFRDSFSQLNKAKVSEYTEDKGQREYMSIVGSTIRRPQLIGFALDKIELNTEGKVTAFSAKACTYRQNIVTCHILEYELYQLFNKKQYKDTSAYTSSQLLDKLPYRKKIHDGNSVEDIVKTGCNRFALISVQMLVAYRVGKQYKVLMIKRSSDVAAKPNFWQFVPAGGFEIFEKDGAVIERIIKNNFQIHLALFRELIEEAFDGEDFEHNEQGEEMERIQKHPRIQEITKWINQGEADLQFVGTVVDLTSLRAEMSFTLIIDNESFASQQFKANHESADDQSIYTEDLQELLEGQNLNPGSAGLLKLAMESDEFKKRGIVIS